VRDNGWRPVLLAGFAPVTIGLGGGLGKHETVNRVGPGAGASGGQQRRGLRITGRYANKVVVPWRL
jgi:hypothetical protein